MQFSFFMSSLQHSLIVLCLEINCVTIMWMMFYCHPHHMHVIHDPANIFKQKTCSCILPRSSVGDLFNIMSAGWPVSSNVEMGFLYIHTKICITRFKLYYFLIYNKKYNLHLISLYITQFCFIKSVCKLYI